jgi:hypothetical protein
VCGCSLNGPDVCNRETEDKRPYHAKSQFEVPVDNVCDGREDARNQDLFDCHSTTILRTLRTDVGELDTSGCDELQSFVYVLGFLHTHTRSLVIAPQ